MGVTGRIDRRRWVPRARWLRTTFRQREAIMGYLLVSPWIIGFLAFTMLPMLSTVVMSFLETNMLKSEFIGLENYIRLFAVDQTISLFWTGLYNTLYYVAISIPLRIGGGFLLALLLNQKIRGRSFYRMVYYLPTVIPGVAVSILWMWLFQPQFGLINWFLSLVGIQGPNWLASRTWAKPALAFMSVWGIGGNMLVFLSGLQAIPTHLYEAATLDGAGAWDRFVHVTLPMVSSTFFFVLITSVISSFKVFTSAYVMTRGGPVNSTMFYVLYLYTTGFAQMKFGFASALAWVFFIIVMLFTILIFRSSSLWVYYETEIGGGES